MSSKREHLILQIKEVEDSIRRKYKALRNAEAESQVAASTQFQPLIEPIETLASNVQHLLKQRGDSTQHKEALPRNINQYQKNIYPSKMEEEEPLSDLEPQNEFAQKSMQAGAEIVKPSISGESKFVQDLMQAGPEIVKPGISGENKFKQDFMRPQAGITPANEEAFRAPLPPEKEEQVEQVFNIPPNERDMAYGPKGKYVSDLWMNTEKVVIDDIKKTITVGKTSYALTDGLKSLLFLKKPIYKEEDLDTYADILGKTKTFLKRSKGGKAPQFKGHSGDKCTLVKELMEKKKQVVTPGHEEKGVEEEGEEEEGEEEGGEEEEGEEKGVVSAEKRAVNVIPFPHLDYPQYTMESRPSRRKMRWSNRLPTPYHMAAPMLAIRAPQIYTPYQTPAPLTTIYPPRPPPRPVPKSRAVVKGKQSMEIETLQNKALKRKRPLATVRTRMVQQPEDYPIIEEPDDEPPVRRPRRREVIQPPRRLDLPWVDRMMLPPSRRRLAIEAAPRRLNIETPPPPAQWRSVYLSSARRRRLDLEESAPPPNKRAKVGRGLPMMELKDSPISYRYWDDPNELLERLKLLKASRDAGNNGLDEEIMSIVEELAEAGYIKEPETYQM